MATLLIYRCVYRYKRAVETTHTHVCINVDARVLRDKMVQAQGGENILVTPHGGNHLGAAPAVSLLYYVI